MSTITEEKPNQTEQEEEEAFVAPITGYADPSTEVVNPNEKNEINLDEFNLNQARERLKSVQSILAKTESEEISDKEKQELSDWLNENNVFGLEAMTDSEYFKLFESGHIYSHAKALFTHTVYDIHRYSGEKHYNSAYDVRPNFFAALTKGFLCGPIIRKQRVEAEYRNEDYFTNDGTYLGQWKSPEAKEKYLEYISYYISQERNLLAEGNSSFDGPNRIWQTMHARATLPEKEVGSGSEAPIHFSYSHPEQFEGGNVPILLVTPQEVLERHGTDTKKENKYQELKGLAKYEYMAGGYHFGSANPDATSKAHEINLDLFTMLIPEISQFDKVLDVMKGLKFCEHYDLALNEEQDEQVKKLFEDLEVRINEFIQDPNKVNQTPIEDQPILSNVFKAFFGKLNEFGIKTPRIFAYIPPGNDRFGLVDHYFIERGLRQFLDAKNIPLQPNDRPEGDQGVLPLEQLPADFIPEEYRLPTVEVEDTANKVRAFLKRG